jgi:hypothetical protein
MRSKGEIKERKSVASLVALIDKDATKELHIENFTHVIHVPY